MFLIWLVWADKRYQERALVAMTKPSLSLSISDFNLTRAHRVPAVLVAVMVVDFSDD